MKIYNSFLIAGMALIMCSCYDTPTGESTKHKPGEGGNDTPDTPNTEVVSPKPDFQCGARSLTVQTAPQQTIRGIGASDCWLGNWIGQYWSTGRADVARLLFSQNIRNGKPDGIGLSMWRVNLGAGTAELGAEGGINDDNANNRAESYLNSSGQYDWNKCVGQRYFMEQAKSFGTESFVLFSNSPLVQYTLNGQGRSDNGAHANLKEDCYDDFAAYMAEVASHFNGLGYNVTHISPLNEPQYSWDGNNQEGSGWQNTEIARLARELDAALTARNCDTKILLPEASSWEALYANLSGYPGSSDQLKALFSPSSEAYVGDLAHIDKVGAAHSYWSYNTWADMRSQRQRAASVAESLGVGLWQTEWSLLGDAPADLTAGYDNSTEFDLAFYMAKVIHNDLTVANCESWSYWTAMSVERWSQKNRFELIKTTPAGGEYSNDFTQQGTVVATDNLWVLGNYSLFVRPGYKRLSTNAEDKADFFTSAYLSPDSKKLVVVCCNANDKEGVTIDFDTKAFGTLSDLYTYTTTANKHLEEARFNIADNVFVYPYSVTTIVYTFE